MRLLLVYNLHSGKKNLEKKLDYIRETLKTKYEVDEYRSHGPKSITLYIKNLDIKYDIIVACGGDGTVNETVSGIMGYKYETVLGIIPRGTINDMGHNLGLNKNYKKSLKLILEGNKKEIDIYKANDSYFSYGFAIGMMTDVSYVKSRSKKFLGRLSYYMLCLKHITKARKIHLKLTINNEIIEDDFSLLLVTNSNYLAGYKIKQNGNLDIALFKGNKFIFVKNFIKYLLTSKNKYYYNAESISIETDAKSFNTDGEYNELDGKVTIEKYKKLNFICKNNKK